MYQALYRKYRPKTFDEVVGQKSIVQTLKTQVSTGRLSHAYLFTGTRGTGKTSCAKILARAVNCEHPEDGNPCNCCAACRSIESGACMDVLEIDAASNNGVDHVRALRDDAIYTPAEVRRRVYIIDEVHMLSMQAFNALLKIIEEPPEHLIFILATTELQKVPATILSRCQRFSFRRLLPEDIAGRLSYVAYQEGIDLEPEAARVLSRLADGALRDGVSLLDQCASATQGAITAETVYSCLGLAGERRVYDLCRAIAAQDASGALSLFSRLYAEGKDIGAMLDELCAVGRDLLVLKTAPKSGLSMLSGLCTGQEAQQLEGLFSAQQLLRMVQLLQSTLADRSQSANQRVDAELCLIRLCAPQTALDASSLSARIGRLEQQIASGVCVPAAAAEKAADEEELPPPPDDRDAPPLEGQLPGEPAKKEAAPTAQDGLPAGFWPELVGALRAQFRPPVKGFFAVDGPITVRLQGDTLQLLAQSEFVKQMISGQPVLQAVAEKASELLGRRVTAQAALQGQGPADGNDRMQELLALQQKLGDKMTID